MPPVRCTCEVGIKEIHELRESTQQCHLLTRGQVDIKQILLIHGDIIHNAKFGFSS